MALVVQTDTARLHVAIDIAVWTYIDLLFTTSRGHVMLSINSPKVRSQIRQIMIIPNLMNLFKMIYTLLLTLHLERIKLTHGTLSIPKPSLRRLIVKALLLGHLGFQGLDLPELLHLLHLFISTAVYLTENEICHKANEAGDADHIDCLLLEAVFIIFFDTLGTFLLELVSQITLSDRLIGVNCLYTRHIHHTSILLRIKTNRRILITCARNVSWCQTGAVNVILWLTVSAVPKLEIWVAERVVLVIPKSYIHLHLSLSCTHIGLNDEIQIVTVWCCVVQGVGRDRRRLLYISLTRSVGHFHDHRGIAVDQYLNMLAVIRVNIVLRDLIIRVQPIVALIIFSEEVINHQILFLSQAQLNIGVAQATGLFFEGAGKLIHILNRSVTAER